MKDLKKGCPRSCFCFWIVGKNILTNSKLVVVLPPVSSKGFRGNWHTQVVDDLGRAAHCVGNALAAAVTVLWTAVFIHAVDRSRGDTVEITPRTKDVEHNRVTTHKCGYSQLKLTHIRSN